MTFKIEKLNMTILILLALIFSIHSSNAQKNSEKLIWKNCKNSKEDNNCGYRYVADILSSHIESIFIDDIKLAKIDTLIVSSRLLFDESGKILPEYSALYSPNGFDMELESILNEATLIEKEFLLIKSQGDQRELISQDFYFSTHGDKLNLIDINLISHKKGFSNFIVEKVPVYSGCDANMTNREILNCNSLKLTEHFYKLYNTPKELDEGTYKMKLKFFVNTQGIIEDISIESDINILEKEALRVANEMEDFDQPGYIGKKAVRVPFMLPLTIIK